MAGLTAEEPIWLHEGARKRASVQSMFSEIAPTYDLLNGILSFSLHHRWRRIAVRSLRLPPAGRALDLCCGTGDFLRMLRAAVPNGVVVGLDFALPMLQIARRKEADASLSLGDACRLPIRSGSLDGVAVGWGIRNLADVDAAHREIARVLKPGGRFVSLDMSRPRNPLVRSASEAFCGTMIPLLGLLFRQRRAYTYLPRSAQRFMTREQLGQSMERAGLVDVGWRDLMLGNICMHWGVKP